MCIPCDALTAHHCFPRTAECCTQPSAPHPLFPAGIRHHLSLFHPSKLKAVGQRQIPAGLRRSLCAALLPGLRGGDQRHPACTKSCFRWGRAAHSGAAGPGRGGEDRMSRPRARGGNRERLWGRARSPCQRSAGRWGRGAVRAVRLRGRGAVRPWGRGAVRAAGL